MAKNIWNSNIPVEKSSYLQDHEITYFNLDHFHYDPNQLAMLDLFCGAGGFAVGCGWAGFQSVLGIDHFQPAMKTWVLNHPHSIGCLGDIKSMDPHALKQLLRDRGVNKIHLITGGVPCQGFSIANRKHNDRDERNFLFLEYMRFVEVFEPDYIILENVSGLRSTAGGHFETRITKYMEKLHYTPTVQLVNAADFGVPQVRCRLIFVGVRKQQGLSVPYTFPRGSFSGRYRTVGEAISDLPPLDNNQSASHYSTPPQNDFQRLMRGLDPDIPIPPSPTLHNHVAPNHPDDTIAMIRGTLPGQPMYSKFKQRIRLRSDQPSPTQLAGGIRPQFQFGHPTQPRGLTIRERARIQSFPDSYIFQGGIVQERVQTGNAVPPLMIYHLTKPIAADIRRKEQAMYRVWYSTESFADFIIDHTKLSSRAVVKQKLYESDANNPNHFHTMPDHIRKILYLDAPDLIVEKDNEPVFSVEVSTEAGTGHNAFQRFARLAASVENSVPAFYIYPEGVIISRKNTPPRWDVINPAVLQALEEVMNIYDIPALLYYFPSDVRTHLTTPLAAPHLAQKGLVYDPNLVRYASCPDASTPSIQALFTALNEVIDSTETYGILDGRQRLLRTLTLRDHRAYMQRQFHSKAKGRSIDTMSPVSAVSLVPTRYLLNYLDHYQDRSYQIGNLLRAREYTAIYQVNAAFRGDPYPGALAAIDYLKCRQGKTFEDRRHNLVLLFGQLEIDDANQTLVIRDQHGSTISDFFAHVQNSAKHNLLTRDYTQLRNREISRYLMQVRYGSSYSKVKHIRVYSYFADAILFPDGSLWRDG